MAVRQRTSIVILCLLAVFGITHLAAQQPAGQQTIESTAASAKIQAAKAAALKQQAAKSSAAAAALAQVQQPAAAPLQITLTPVPAAPYAGQPVQLIVTPDRPVTTAAYFFQWDDHTEDTATRVPQAVHTYATAGTYRVTVHVRATVDGRGEPAEATLTLTVISAPAKSSGYTGPTSAKKPVPLRITLNPDPSAPYAGQTVRVTASTNYPVSIAKYAFDWGDKTPPAFTSEPQAAHVYTSPGPYNISVQVHALVNDNDVSASNSLGLTVNSPPPPPPPPQNPTLTLTASETHSLVGHPITFTVASDPPTGFTEFQYHFGDSDGPAEPGPNGVEYAYPRPGTYYATASTLSADGQTTITSPEVQIRITPAPLPELVLNLLTSNLVAKGSTVVSANLDPREPDATYRFDWGDGTPADTIDSLGRASHAYANPGTYNLSVVAVIAVGTVAGQRTIIVAAPPRPPIPVYPVLFAILVAGILASWAYHHFHAPTGELHSTFGVSRAVSSEIKMPDSAEYLSLTFTSGADASDHDITFP